MSSDNELELAQAEVRYYQDRVALLRAKQYRWGLSPSPRLKQLEQKLQSAERRLSALRLRNKPDASS
jgi:hypothetical protein